jgi:hypothetical protein
VDADRDQLERIRAKAYAIAEGGGPNADQARRILSKLPKINVGQGFNQPGLPKDNVYGELSGGDIGEELPQTPDETVGLKNKLRELPIGAKAAMVAASPPTRREFIRGVDDMVAFGAGQRIAGGVDRALSGGRIERGFERMGLPLHTVTPEQGREDVRDAPNARTTGQLLGAMIPGATNLVGKASLGVVSPLTSAGRGLVGKATTGALGGAIANEIAMPVIAGGQTAVAGPRTDEDLGSYASRIGSAMKEQALNPTNAAAGALLGLPSGFARGIRETGQTGIDIRLVEEYGAKPSMIGRGPQGGVFDSPFFANAEGTAGEQGMASGRAARAVLGAMDEEGAALGRRYASAKASARDQGWLEGKIDTNGVREEANRLIAGTSLTSGERAAIQREVLDELNNYPGGMSVDEFNDFRGKLGRIFGVGGGETAVPAIDRLRQSAKRTVDETEMGPINEEYSKGRQRISRQHEQLGIAEGGRRDIQERRVANLIQRRANDEAPGTGIQEELGTRDFLAENPQHTPMFDVARLLAAKERMTAGIEPQGGFFRRVGKHGLLEKNLEPALVGAYRLGRPMEQGSISAALAAQFLLNGGIR